MWSLLVTLLVTGIVTPPPQAGGTWPTLAETLRAAAVPLPSGTAGTTRITSYDELNDAGSYVIGYYDLTRDNHLQTLHVRAFDKRRRTWQSVTLQEIGSILSIHRSGPYLVVEGHASPSGSAMLVLNDRLAVRQTLEGWPALFLADGRLIYVRAMVHFAPTHAEVLAVYDPAANRDATLYPVGTDNFRGGEQVSGTDLWVDRSIQDVKETPAHDAIAFSVKTQQMRLNAQQNPEAAGPEESFRVTCSLAGRPACRRY